MNDHVSAGNGTQDRGSPGRPDNPIDVTVLLSRFGALCGLDLVAALQGDLTERWQGGARCLVEPYLLHPSLVGDDEAILDLIYHEFLIRTQYGDRPRIEEYVERFPRYGDRLCRLLSLDRALFSGEPIAQRPSQTVAHGPAAPTRQEPPSGADTGPTRIGKYRVIALLGAGGQGEVYRAAHPTLGKDVVIKIAQSRSQAGDFPGLLDEGRALAELDHPGLARVYDLDFHEGRPFLVLEHRPGRSLAQTAREQPYAPLAAARLVAGVARALAEAHRRGLVHRDLKPANILIGDDGNPCVIDFGLVRIQQPWAPEHAEQGLMCGTVEFMSPEQANGRADQADARSDVFSLGGVLYSLLTGVAPFGADNPQAALRAARACQWSVERLGAARVPRRLRAVCVRAMAREPKDRYASAEEFARELESLVRGWRRVPLFWAALVLASVVLAGAWWSFGHKREEASIAASAEQPLPAMPTLEVRVVSGKRYRSLLQAVPLRTGARLEVVAELPAEFHGGLFLFSSGRWTERVRWPPAASARGVRYPARMDEAVPLTGPPGTELVLLCGRRSGPLGLVELRALWPDSRPWPTLSGQSVLRLWPAQVRLEQKARDFGAPVRQGNPEGEVRQRLEDLRQRLRGQVGFFEGLAFSHGE